MASSPQITSQSQLLYTPLLKPNRRLRTQTSQVHLTTTLSFFYTVLARGPKICNSALSAHEKKQACKHLSFALLFEVRLSDPQN